MSADNAFAFMAFFVATVASASLIGCAVDRGMTAWQTARAVGGTRDRE